MYPGGVTDEAGEEESREGVVFPKWGAVLDVFETDLAGKRLWHYTSAAAARSIVSSGTLRLGSSRFMNDPGEGKLASALVRNALSRARKGALTEPEEQILQISESDSDAEVFLSSFALQNDAEDDPDKWSPATAHDGRDLLSQWAMYAEDGNGVALVFEVLAQPDEPILKVPEALKFTKRNGDVFGSTYECPVGICSVKYVPRDGAEIDAAFDLAFRDVGPAGFIASDLNRAFASLIKSDYYQQEHECRIYARVPLWLAQDGHLTDTRPIEFGDNGKLYLTFPWTESLQLRSYWLGPRSSRQDEAAARLFLDQLGQADVKVHTSRGAYRGKG